MRLLRSPATVMFLAMWPNCMRAELLPIRSYTTADGLAADRVRRIVADSHGFLWFCTPEGLSRFDGYRFVNFGVAEGLPHRSVTDLLETRSGDYLVATAHGLCRFRPADGNKFTTYLPPGNNPLQSEMYALLEAPSGRIWCGTDDGPFELLRPLRFTPQALARQRDWDRVIVLGLLEDTAGKLWVATATGLYVAGKNGAVEHLGEPEGLPNEWVNTLLRDRDGRIWAGTRGGLALMRETGGRVGVERVYANMVGAPNVQALAQAADGTIWMGTPFGINRLPPGGGPAALQHLSRENGLTDLAVIALTQDRAGNMWVGTEGAGVMRIAAGGFITFREQDGLASDRLTSVLGDRAGTVLAVSSLGRLKGFRVASFDGTKFRPVAPSFFAGLHSWGLDQILLQSRAGEWWEPTKDGLCRLPASSRSAVCYARDVSVFKVFEDSKGGIWASGQAATSNRLVRWDPKTKSVSFFSPVPNRPLPLFNAFAEDHGRNVWLGSFNGDLIRYDGRQFTPYGQSAGVPAGAISALLVDRAGRLWIGASNGLGVIENPGAAQIAVRWYGVADGLASDDIVCLIDDAGGHIYVGNGKGVDRLEPATGHIKHFSSADGLALGELKSAYRDRFGDLWFATSQGLSRLSVGNFVDRPPARPSVLITNLRFGREIYPVSQAGASTIRRGKLPPSENHIQVEFAGFSDEPEENLRYTYKLESGDSDWQAPSREHQANYPGLRAGSYRFLVKAVNSEGQASATPAEIDFTISPTVVASWWFRTLAAILAAMAIYLLYRYRLTRLLEMERLRTRIATDLHDDIGSSLSQIAILSEVTSRRVAPEHQADLADIANLSRELVDSMSEIVWAIDPAQDRLGDLAHRMRRFASDLFTPAGVRVHFQMPDAGKDDPEMGADIRRQIFLIFKEALHNMARHSGCTEVEIEFRVEKGWLSLNLADNGRGFDPARTQRGHGLDSMEQRARQLGGSLTVDAAPGRGTAIRLQVPIGQQIMGRRKKSYING